MIRTVLLSSVLAATLAVAQVQNFKPVTEQELENPSPNDWLMFSRTLDAQRFSPLNQITTANVGQLRTAWVRGLPEGQTETTPIVRGGVMYVIAPGAIVQALDATNGDLLWEYKHDVPTNVGRQARSKSLAIFGDIIAFTAPDSTVVGLDARTGELRWKAQAEKRGHTSGPIIADGKVISSGGCAGGRESCFVSAHDALTGKELWRWYTTPDVGEPGDESWNGAPVKNRLASTWGSPGSYDPQHHLIIWGIANPMPEQRAARHGSADKAGKTAPADLYSNSTVALDPDTGKLVWYYQHLPADDWDLDHTNERQLVRVKLNPDPKYVKWINPAIKPGEERDVSVNISEGGGLSLIDRTTGQFLWATPFPFDTPYWAIKDIDPKTGAATINYDLVFKQPGETHTVCYWNTKSYWPAAYDPQTNSLYTSYIDNCREQTTAGPQGRGSWKVVQRPGGIRTRSPGWRRSICRRARSCGSTWGGGRATGRCWRRPAA